MATSDANYTSDNAWQTEDTDAPAYQDQDETQYRNDDRQDLDRNPDEALNFDLAFQRDLEALNGEAAEALYGQVDITEYPEHQRLEYQQAYVTAFLDATQDQDSDDVAQAADQLAERLITPYRHLLAREETATVIEHLSNREFDDETMESLGLHPDTHDIIIIPKDPNSGDAFQWTSEGKVPIGNPPRFQPIYIDPTDEYEQSERVLDHCQDIIKNLLRQAGSERHNDTIIDDTAAAMDSVLLEAAAYVKPQDTAGTGAEDGGTHQHDHLATDNTEARLELEDRIRQDSYVMAATAMTQDVYTYLRDQLRELADDETKDRLVDLADNLHAIRLQQLADASQDSERFGEIAEMVSADADALLSAAENTDGLAAQLPDDHQSALDIPEDLASSEGLTDLVHQVEAWIGEKTDYSAADTQRNIEILHHHLNFMRAARDQIEALGGDHEEVTDDRHVRDINEDMQARAQILAHVMDRTR